MKKRVCALALAALLLCGTAGCAQTGTDGGALAEIAVTPGESQANAEPTLSDGQFTTLGDTEKTYIAFDGSGIDISTEKSGAAGAAANGSTLTISSGGVYVLSGSLEGGQVVVDAGENDTVQLLLNGVSITAEENAAIYAKQADLLILTLADGTENFLTDAATFTYADAEAEEPDAAVFSKGDMVLNGNGALTVTARYNNGIGTKDDLIIEGGQYTISSANHGIRGRDSLQILGGGYTITAGGDGLQSNNDSGDGKGYVEIANGTFAITAAHDGIQAETTLTIHNGDFTITTGGGYDSTELVDTESYKGLKAAGDILVENGSFTINSADDSLHSNASITIQAGTFLLQTGDDGMHADATLAIHGGSIQIPNCYEGLEGTSVELYDGTITVVARDDAINAAGGTDSGEGGRFGKDQFQQGASGAYAISITGGELTLQAGGDGLDSNGNIYMSGGQVTISTASGGPDVSIDYNGDFVLTGGSLLAAGGTQMAQGPGESSTQPSIMLYYSATQSAGSTVELQAADGSILLDFTPAYDFQCLVLSAPGLELNGSYTVSYNGQAVPVTLSSAITRISDTGEAVAGGMGGMGGGQRPDGGTRPGGAQRGQGEAPTGQPPEGFTPPEGGTLPEGMPEPPQGAPGAQGSST